MFNLGNIFDGKEGTCNHRTPDISFIADLIDREGREVRAYFCHKCNDYRWKYPETAILTEDDLVELKKDKYFFYCDSECLTEFGKFRKK